MDEATLTDASLLIGLGQYDEAECLLERALGDADAAQDDAAAGRALEGLGTIATRRGQELVALELFEQAIERSGPAGVSSVASTSPASPQTTT